MILSVPRIFISSLITYVYLPCPLFFPFSCQVFGYKYEQRERERLAAKRAQEMISEDGGESSEDGGGAASGSEAGARGGGFMRRKIMEPTDSIV
jgi:hypothetical protein